MRGLLLILLIAEPLIVHSGELRYPRVYGFTGRPYGPTQAHYQYQRQYGRAWHGYGGERQRFGHAVSGAYCAPRFGTFGLYNSYGFQTGFAGTVWPGLNSPWGFGSVYAPQSFGYYSIGPTFQFYGGTAVAYPARIPDWNPPPMDRSVMDRFQSEEIERWKLPADTTLSGPIKPTVPESTAAAKLKSLETQLDGDQAFRKQNFPHAYNRYKQATLIANDRGQPHFRMGYTLVAMKQFRRAIEYFKLGLIRSPDWPANGEQIRSLYGADNEIVRSLHLQRLTEWVREDIRDPDRLFLLGIMLHFDGRPKDAATCFETALRLSGTGDHLKLFLQVQMDNRVEPVAGVPEPAAARPEQFRGPLLPPPPAPSR